MATSKKGVENVDTITNFPIMDFVCTLDTELPEDIIPTVRTLVALYVLERKRIIYMQFDDSAADQLTANQLSEICNSVGYCFHWEMLRHSAYLYMVEDVIEV